MTGVHQGSAGRILFICLWLFAMAARGQQTVTAPAKPERQSVTNPIVDLMLIYDGGVGRQPWTAERFKPYVYRERNGNFEWLFDGFLFIDFFAKSGARLAPISHHKDANRQDWQALMDHYFSEDQSIAALDELLDSLAARGHVPPRKRQVVITLPTPITGSKPDEIDVTSTWGELDGKKMDFTQAEDRMKAARWYIDSVLKRWREKHYKHLELAGFYWVFERAWQVNHTQEIGDYIRSQGSRLYWIPSWPQGRTNWQEYGFDFVYQQPNYFFHRKPTPSDRLEAACAFAESCGTGMEMEFNRDLLTKPVFLGYFDEYLQAYAKHGVWEKRAVAYYEGGDTWGAMAQSNDPEVKRRFKALGDIVVQRQKRGAEGLR